MSESTTATVCPCGHPKAEHDYFGCIYGSCQYTCKRKYGALLVGKPEQARKPGEDTVALHG